MTDLEQRVQAWFGFAVEVVYTFFAFVLASLPLLALGDDAFGEPLGTLVVPLVLAVGVAGTVAFELGEYSFDRLGHFVVAAFAAAVGWVLVVSSLVLVLDLWAAPRDPLPMFVAWSLSLATASLLVYRGEDALA
ncbi:hypothetical protein [Halorubellus sp. PRR65]|uniref:hypothetical protein n=1 Tax=Halorubellus sp. PRR65 TaxID=3098148 RepID=UPI002B25B375|nr:hypothetical protein [Halorubellus sp. PRR65]